MYVCVCQKQVISNAMYIDKPSGEHSYDLRTVTNKFHFRLKNPSPINPWKGKISKYT